jgi:hypothetical protein
MCHRYFPYVFTSYNSSGALLPPAHPSGVKSCVHFLQPQRSIYDNWYPTVILSEVYICAASWLYNWMKGSNGARWPKILLPYTGFKFLSLRCPIWRKFQKGLTKKAERKYFISGTVKFFWKVFKINPHSLYVLRMHWFFLQFLKTWYKKNQSPSFCLLLWNYTYNFWKSLGNPIQRHYCVDLNLGFNAESRLWSCAGIYKQSIGARKEPSRNRVV